MELLRIAGVALLSLVVILTLRELRPALAPPTRAITVVLLLTAAISLYAPVVTRIEGLLNVSGADALAGPLLRALGIATICELTAIFCQDLGEQSIAEGVRLFGRLEILILSLPLLDKVLDIAKELLEF